MMHSCRRSYRISYRLKTFGSRHFQNTVPAADMDKDSKNNFGFAAKVALVASFTVLFIIGVILVVKGLKKIR